MISPVNAIQRQRFYQRLDWDKPDVELAAITGRSRSVIATWRRKLGMKALPHSQVRRHVQLLRAARKWNWKDGASALAAQHGISREWVYRIGEKINRRPGR